MNEYNFNIDRWYVYDASRHGKLDAGLWLAVPYEIMEWFDNEEDYLNRVNNEI